jgi:hypothetical protein
MWYSDHFEAKKVLRRKKRCWEKKKLEVLEELQNRNEIHAMFKGIRVIRKGFQPRTKYCMDKEGLMIREKIILERWMEHFEELLNIEQVTPDALDEVVDGQMNAAGEQEPVPEVTREEVKEAITFMRNNHTPGEDGLSAELINSMYTLIRSMWESEEMPGDWSLAVICPIYMESDKTVCSNNCGISLLNVAYKIFSKILARRLEPYAEKQLGEYQCGF